MRLAAAAAVVLIALPGMAPAAQPRADANAGLAAPPRADANGGLVILGVKTIKRDPKNFAIDPEPPVEQALPDVGGLIFVPWRGNRGAEVTIDDPAQFRKPKPHSGTVSRDARVFRVKAGPIAFDVAIDSNSPDVKLYQVLRLDPTCKGDFRNAPCVGIFNTAKYGPGIISQRESYQYDFIANPLDLMVGKRKISVLLHCVFKEERPLPGQEPPRHVTVALAGAATGNCRFGDAVHRVFSPDPSGRMIGNDKGKIVLENGIPDLRGDWYWLYVDLGKGGSLRGFYGYPYVVDGKLWDITISDAGDQISAKEYAGPAGKLHIDHPFWEAQIASEENMMYLKAGVDPVPVPVGRYRILYYGEWGKAAGGSKLNQIGMDRDRQTIRQEPLVEIEAGKTAEVVIGSPVQITIVPQVQGRTVHFRLQTADVARRQRVNMVADDNAGLGDWEITDAAGKQVGVIKIVWGDGAWEGAWSASAEMKGTFGISVPAAFSSIPLKSERATFTIGGG